MKIFLSFFPLNEVTSVWFNKTKNYCVYIVNTRCSLQDFFNKGLTILSADTTKTLGV